MAVNIYMRVHTSSDEKMQVYICTHKICESADIYAFAVYIYAKPC